MQKLLVALVALCLAAAVSAQVVRGAVSPQAVRAVDADYWKSQVEREALNKQQAMRYALGNTRFEIVPDRATDRHTLRVKVGIVYGAVAPGHCPDPERASVHREGSRVTIFFPSAPCANPLAESVWPLELAVGRLAPGEYVFDLQVPNELEIAPVKSAAVTIRPVASEDEALAIAADEGTADVVELVASHRFPQDTLDAVLSHVCWPGRAAHDDSDTVRVLLRAGASPAAAVHAAAIGSPVCLKQLLAAGADSNLDLAVTTGILVGTGRNAFRYKPGKWGTPLHFAVQARNLDNVRVLLDAGAEPNKTFGDGTSAYAESFALGDDERARELRRLLEEHGGSRTAGQRLTAMTRQAASAVGAGAFVSICQLSAWKGRSCMH